MKPDLRLAVLAAALAAGCAVTAVKNERLDQARASYRQAAGDALVQRYAQPELQSAAAALNDAERLATAGRDADLVEHNAYLAERRARTALAAAQARQAEVDIVAAREARRRAELEARQREVAAERTRAEEAEARARLLEQKAAGYEREKTVSAELAAELQQLESEAGVRAKQTPRGWVLTLDDEALFERGTMFQPAAERTLDNVAQFLRKRPERKVAVEVSSASTGPKDASERLSVRRAEALKFALVQRGVEPHRIDTRRPGSSPAAAAASDETVEIVVGR